MRMQRPGLSNATRIGENDTVPSLPVLRYDQRDGRDPVIACTRPAQFGSKTETGFRFGKTYPETKNPSPIKKPGRN